MRIAKNLIINTLIKTRNYECFGDLSPYTENEDIPKDDIMAMKEKIRQLIVKEKIHQVLIYRLQVHHQQLMSSFQEHESKKSRISNFVSLDMKLKIINIVRQHPK
ncbi:hypothetical protein K0M31_001829 [Melipona bicolor]|uniref:Uncharacterized protein n=1 Tax=Melipona bicolor TaxID=60889 RepID=A0AA40GGK7_9HYME|nr:hypothetical protein K0M31_001829 [Melipona bicolor]